MLGDMRRLETPDEQAVHVWDLNLLAPRAVPLADVLSRYEGSGGEELAISIGEFGKPYLPRGDAPRFNVAHSGRRGLVAVAADREIGVDLEAVRWRPRWAGMTRRWFSERERRHVDAHVPSERLAAFHRVWAVKEACVKASGLGLQALDATDVDLPLTGGSGLWSVTADGQWSVRMLDAGPGWAAAVAVEGADWRPEVELRRF